MRTGRMLTMMTAFALVATACGQGGDAAEPQAAEDGAAEAVAADDTGEAEREEEFWRIATGGTGGTYYPQGGTLVSMIQEHFSHVTASSEVTGASAENARLLDRGEVDIAMLHADAIAEALPGIGDFEGEPIDMRAISLLFVSYMQLATMADSGITSIEDLRGRNVAVGEAGGAPEMAIRGILDVFGMTYDDLGSTPQLGYADTTAAFRDGRVDVGNYFVTLNAAALEELAQTFEIGMVRFTEAEMDQIREHHASHLGNGTIPAGTYPGQDEDWCCVPAAPNYIVVSPDFDRSDAYELTKIIHEQVERLINTHPSAEDISMENMVALNNMLPLHPGTIDYFLEQGIDVPDALYPSDWTD